AAGGPEGEVLGYRVGESDGTREGDQQAGRTRISPAHDHHGLIWKCRLRRRGPDSGDAGLRAFDLSSRRSFRLVVAPRVERDDIGMFEVFDVSGRERRLRLDSDRGDLCIGDADRSSDTGAFTDNGSVVQ